MKFNRFFLYFLKDERGWTTEMAVTGVAAVDAAIPEYWADGIMADANRESFWGQLAGKEGSMMPVIDKTGPLKKNGDQLDFSIIAQLMGSGVTGENVLKGNEETLSVGTFTVSADVIRHAVAVSRKSTKQAQFDEIKIAKTLLTDWGARKLDTDVFSTILGSSAVTTLYANGKTAVGNLNETDGDFFAPADISLMRMALIRQGAQPLKVTKVNGRSIPIYGLVMSEVEEYRLNQNTVFAQAVKDAWARFNGGNETHPLFRSAAGIYGNMLLFPYYSTLPLPQGTALRPETIVLATLTTAETTTLSVGTATPSAGAIPNSTLYFASSGSLQIGDEIISYTAKTNNTFTTLTRGVSSTTAVQHVPNELVTQRNVASVIGFGAEAVCRAFPEQWEPIGQKDDYEEQIGLGIRGYYGHAVTVDKRRSKSSGLVVLKALSKNPGTV